MKINIILYSFIVILSSCVDYDDLFEHKVSEAEEVVWEGVFETGEMENFLNFEAQPVEAGGSITVYFRHSENFGSENEHALCFNSGENLMKNFGYVPEITYYTISLGSEEVKKIGEDGFKFGGQALVILKVVYRGRGVEVPLPKVELLKFPTVLWEGVMNCESLETLNLRNENSGIGIPENWKILVYFRPIDLSKPQRVQVFFTQNDLIGEEEFALKTLTPASFSVQVSGSYAEKIRRTGFSVCGENVIINLVMAAEEN